MRVLAIVNNFPWPGNIDGIFNLRQLRAVQGQGHDVRVVRVTPLAPPLQSRWNAYCSIPAQYTMEGIEVRTLRAVMAPRNFGLETLRLQTRLGIAREIERFKPDVLHVHGLLPAGVMALDAGSRFVLTAHGTETYRTPWIRSGLTALARKVVRRAGACVGVSDFVASHLRKLGARETTVIFNGADEHVFYPRDRQAARASLGMDLDRPAIAFAGHLTRAKGMEELQARRLRLQISILSSLSQEKVRSKHR